jgi:type I restriction enzyme S subunit
VLDTDRLRSLEIPALPLSEQRNIASTIGGIDDKIELNRRMNETLEGMAQAIFRDWFVDFGPVRRVQAGEADPVAIMGGLTPDPARAAHLAALFPAAFGNDGLPVGWTSQPVSTFADIRGGKQLEKQHTLPVGPNPVFGGAGIMGYATISNADGYVITVGRVGAYCGQFFGHRGAAWVNNNASLIKPSVSTPPEWLLLALRESDIESIKRGAAQPFVSNGDVSKLPLVDAGSSIRAAFEEIIRPLFLLSEARQAESETLAETRDYLLPRLMSGAVRVATQAEAA